LKGWLYNAYKFRRKYIQNNKEVKNAREGGRSVFSSIISFIDSTEQQQQKYQDIPIIKERGYILFGKEEKRHTAIKTHRLWLITTRGLIIHKLGYKIGCRDIIMISIYLYIERTPHVVTPKKEVVDIFNLGGYIGIEKDFPEQPYHHYLTEKKEEKPRKVIPKRRKRRNQQKSF